MSQTKLIIYQLKLYINDLDDNVKRKKNICSSLSISFDFIWLFDLPVNPPGWLIDWKISWFVTRAGIFIESMGARNRGGRGLLYGLRRFVFWPINRSVCRAVTSLVGWLVKWLAGWLAGWMAGWLVGWLDGWLAGWLAGWLTGWLAGWFVGWMIVCLVGLEWMTQQVKDM
jgi:hypothetical protein